MTHPEKQQRHAPGVEAAATSMAADAVCGKTARACDGCVRRRARWYCAADDAFLCQGCDSSVHSANPLARRHQRIRLKTAASSPPPPPSCGIVLQAVKPEEALVPAWLTGFKRKARTPRSMSQAKAANTGSRSQASTTVPDLVEMSVDENEEEVEEEEEHALLYRVPIFDPVLAEFCSPPLPLDDANASSVYDAKSSVTAELSDCAPTTSASSVDDAADGQLASFLPTDMELAEFAANMESLLSGAVDGSDDSFCMEKLGLVDPMDHDGGCCMRSAGSVKAEQQAEGDRDHERYDELDDVDFSRETLELSFELGSPINGDDREPKEEKTDPDAAEAEAAEQGGVKTAVLRLDYEAIIAAWANQGASPWTDGKRPQVSTDGCWPDYMGMWMHGGVQTQGGGGEGGMAAHNDVGREARVSRYREKRRTRLFSKKIRYEVRKLNAEKRPRMKGRFVKRAPCAAMGVAH